MLAGREGFEPSVEALVPYKRLAGAPVRPLRHLPDSVPSGGGRGIRTPGGLPHSCFQDSRLRPLGHPSGFREGPPGRDHSTMTQSQGKRPILRKEGLPPWQGVVGAYHRDLCLGKGVT